ncbi:unnamed protein product [Urochloa humidicola]
MKLKSQPRKSDLGSADLVVHTETAARSTPTTALATLPAAWSWSSRREQHSAGVMAVSTKEEVVVCGAGATPAQVRAAAAAGRCVVWEAKVNRLLDLLVRAEEKRVEKLIHHHVIHYHLHLQRRKLIRLETMDRWPYQLQMTLAGIVPHLLDKGRKDSLKIRDELVDSLHKD